MGLVQYQVTEADGVPTVLIDISNRRRGARLTPGTHGGYPHADPLDPQRPDVHGCRYARSVRRR
jgi:hypothetical protein